jgi:hypothetical protein
MNKKKFFFIIIFLNTFVLLTNTTLASTNLENHPPFCLENSLLKKATIKNIQVEIYKNRKWQKNLFNAYLNNHKYISKKFKAKFKGRISVFFSRDRKCSYSAKIRFSGDARDHLRKIDNRILSSIDVEIDENILGIVRFKLILPETRFSENEVFTNLLLNKFGFLSPKSFLIPVTINNSKSSKFIFVESSLRKEFLESQKRIEGPILSADDENLFNEDESLKKIALARLRNAAWIKNDQDKLDLSIEAITRLNYFFISQSLRSRQFGLILNGNLDRFEKSFFVNENFLEEYYKYSLLINSLGATSSFTLSDSRFYYNPIKRDFELIYNDGHNSILTLPDRVNYQLFDKNHSGFSEKLITDLKNINIDEFLYELKDLNVDLKKKKLIQTLNSIAKRTDKIANKAKDIPIQELEFQDFYNYDNFLKLVNNTNQFYSYYSAGKFYLCKAKNLCDELILNHKEILKLLSQRLKVKNKKVFFLGNEKIKTYNSVFSNYWKSLKIENINIYYTSEKSIKYDVENKVIYLNPIDNSSRFLIIDSTIDNWTIKYNLAEKFFLPQKNTKEINKNYFKIDNKYYKSLAGCLTFYNVNFQNTSITSNSSICEDAINIIKSNGFLEFIKVKGSFSDGVDFDFSNLNLKNIEVINSKNDCIDMSYGKYTVENINSINCGDKGISIGEKSHVTINFLQNSNSLYSVAVKDSSSVFINKVEAINFLKTCLNIYRKKQEFEGAYLNINSINSECKNGNNFIQKNSKLIIKNDN